MMTTKTIIITALPAGRCGGGLESSILAVKRPSSAMTNLSPKPQQILYNFPMTMNQSSKINTKNSIKYESYDDDDDDDEDDEDDMDLLAPPRKRERLTHLTPEEKLFRRKMKNRIAAQTARDRKKALMGDLEDRIRWLEAENAALKSENLQLKQKSGSLNDENGRIKRQMVEKRAEISQNVGDFCDKKGETTMICNENSQQQSVVKLESARNASELPPVDVLGSAASINAPLQREQATPGWVLKWLLTVLTALSCSNFSNNSSETTTVATVDSKATTEPLPLTEIINRIKTLPISKAGKELLTSKLAELLHTWKATRKKAPELD